MPFLFIKSQIHLSLENCFLYNIYDFLRKLTLQFFGRKVNLSLHKLTNPIIICNGNANLSISSTTIQNSN